MCFGDILKLIQALYTETNVTALSKDRFFHAMYRTFISKCVFFFHSYIAVAPLTPEQKEERWQELSADLSSFLQNEDGGLPAIVNPFDPVSDVPEEDQK